MLLFHAYKSTNMVMGDFYSPLPVGQYMYFLELPQQNATGGVADTTEINLLTVLAA